MALDPKIIAQLKKDLKEINELYAKIGKEKISIDLETIGIDDIKLLKQYLKEAREENALLFGSFRDIQKEVNEIFSGLNSITDEIKNGRQGFDLTKKAVTKLTDIMGKVKDIQDDISTANSSDLIKLQEKALAERKNLEEAQRLLMNHENINDETSKEYIALQNINGILEKNDGIFHDINETLKQVVKNEEILEEKTGLLGTLAESFSGGLKKAGLGALESKLGIQDALKSTKDMVAAQGGNVSKMQAGVHLAGQLGTNLMKSLGPVTLIALAVEKIVEAFKFIDNSSGEVAEKFAISAKEGRELVKSSNDIATTSGNLSLNTKNVLAAQISLNEQFKTSVKFSDKIVTEFASIQKKTGLSSEAMGKFAEQAMITGNSMKTQLATIQGVTMELNAQEKVSLNQRDIQEGIANVSNAVLLSTGRNTKELANQVFQTKLLGISQSQLENTASSLLDFQSSIEAEMEAELLLGKQINLEKARAAALTNDQATLAAELRKEVGTAAEFGKLNVIQQEALAKAFGMNREEMASMLVEQEKLESIRQAGFKSLSDAQEKYNKALEEGNLSEKLKNELQEAGLLNQFESMTVQDKLNTAIEKLSDLFVAIVEPLMPIIDAIISILNPIAALLSPIFKLIGDLISLTMTGLKPGFAAIEKYFKGIADLYTSIFNLDFDGVIGAIKNIGKSIIDFLVYPVQGWIDLFNKIPGVDINLNVGEEVSKFIGLAEGGIVTKPTTALIGEGGEPEAVIPLSKAQSMGFGNNNESNNNESNNKIKQKNISLKELSNNNGNNNEIEQTNILLKELINDNKNNNEIKQTNILLKELIATIKQGSDVYIDGAKIGKSLALATSRMG